MFFARRRTTLNHSAHTSPEPPDRLGGVPARPTNAHVNPNCTVTEEDFVSRFGYVPAPPYISLLRCLQEEYSTATPELAGRVLTASLVSWPASTRTPRIHACFGRSRPAHSRSGLRRPSGRVRKRWEGLTGLRGRVDVSLPPPRCCEEPVIIEQDAQNSTVGVDRRRDQVLFFQWRRRDIIRSAADLAADSMVGV